ncbi:MAG: methyltransferase domain-containing protein [Actinomycetota bacterium]|nr:methyltransferase domain-containing protein [Actinomycetota bacterium]
MAHNEIVDRYSDLARAALSGETVIDCAPDTFDEGCFGAAGYDDLTGLPQAATRASLGCGNPVAVAELRFGQTVLDLGSGGGIDVLLSAKRVGPDGKVYGLDASGDMVQLARRNAEQADTTNVEFLHGTIEDIPLPDLSVDVVISNCVINLSSDKPAVFAEVFRILGPHGRIGISDVIAEDGTTPEQRARTEQRVGCVAGALTVSEYRGLLLAAGFVGISITATIGHGDGVHSSIIQATKPAITH